MRQLSFLLLASLISEGSAAQFGPLKSSKSAKTNDGFYRIDGGPGAYEGSQEKEKSEKKLEKESEKESEKENRAKTEVIEEALAKEEPRTLDDFSGVTVSGIPRLIRASPETEIFFRDVNTSYIIPKDSKHNQYYHAFETASRLNKSVSFRVDPVSRRVLAVDGVNGVVSAKPPAGAK